VVSRLRGRVIQPSQSAPLDSIRTVLVLLYGFLRHCFWLLLITFLIWKVSALIHRFWAITSRLSLLELEGLRTGNIPLIAASLIRFGLFTLMALALGTLLAGLVLKFVKWLWSKASNQSVQSVDEAAKVGHY
jgi:hypothetical protein